MLLCKNDMLAWLENEGPPEVSGSNNRRFHPIFQELLLFASCLLLNKVMALHDLLCAILHRYRRGHGFESRLGLNFFQALISQLLCEYLRWSILTSLPLYQRQKYYIIYESRKIIDLRIMRDKKIYALVYKPITLFLGLSSLMLAWKSSSASFPVTIEIKCFPILILLCLNPCEVAEHVW